MKRVQLPSWRLEKSLNSEIAYFDWNDCVNDLLAMYAGEYKDLVITARVTILFSDGHTKQCEYELHSNGVVTFLNFVNLYNSLSIVMDAPYHFVGDYMCFYNNVLNCRFNCIVKIVVS